MIQIVSYLNFIPFTLFPPPSLFLIFTDGTSAVWHAGPRGNSTDLGDFTIQFPALRQPFVVSQASTRRNPESISVYHDDSTVVTLSTLTTHIGWINLEASWEATEWQSLLLACHVSQLLRMRIADGHENLSCCEKKSPFFWGWSISFWESTMDAMKIENFFGSGRLELRRPSKHGKYDEVLSIVDVVVFTTVMAVWCAFAICRVTSYENIVQTAVGNQQYWEKKCNKSDVSKALSICFPVFATSPLAVLQAWHAPSEYWDPAIKNPLPSSKKVPKKSKSKNMTPKNV